MESDLKTLLEARKLGDTVPVLEAYGVQGLETLELLEDTDIDAMAMIEKYPLAPMTGRLLKKELPMLVPALAQKRKEQYALASTCTSRVPPHTHIYTTFHTHPLLSLPLAGRFASHRSAAP